MSPRQATSASAASAWNSWETELDGWCSAGTSDSTHPIIGHDGLLAWEMEFDEECGIDSSYNQQDWETEFDQECGSDLGAGTVTSTHREGNDVEKEGNNDDSDDSSQYSSTTTTQATMDKVMPDAQAVTPSFHHTNFPSMKSSIQPYPINSKSIEMISNRQIFKHGHHNGSGLISPQHVPTEEGIREELQSADSAPTLALIEEKNDISGREKLDPISLMFCLADQLEHLNVKMESRKPEEKMKSSALTEENVKTLDGYNPPHAPINPLCAIIQAYHGLERTTNRMLMRLAAMLDVASIRAERDRQ